MRRLSFPHAFYLLLAMVLVSVTACDDDDDAPACDLSATATAEAFEINVAATGGTAPYRYSIDGENFDSNTRIEVDEATNYTVTVRDANDCEVTVDVTGDNLDQFTDTRGGTSTTYSVVKIGDQIWLGENLNYITDDDSFCYDDLPANCTEDGRLYTWDAAREAVPTGWRLPSVSEVQTLIEGLGGEFNAAVAMQPNGSSGWEEQFAGRYFVSISIYQDQDVNGYYWTSEEEEGDNTEAQAFRVGSGESPSVRLRDDDKEERLSVRLIKD
ncbi:MAG: FISUMP domain-containing protein [Bacteroidota bacterium]